VWVVEVDRAALVLGSTQHEPAPNAEIDVVRRRSGGGAVLVEPGGLVWVDVFVPAGDPLWEPDVGRAFLWLGQAWAAALGGGTVHTGALCRTPWSRDICFAGLGPGEVTVGGAKVVGMAQRRARAGALFQCAALRAWDPAPLVALLGLPPQAAVELATVACGVDVDADDLLARLPPLGSGCR
jgi:lipoate---protein ligase